MLNSHFKVSYTFLKSDSNERITINVGENMPFNPPIFLVNNE